MESSAPSTPAPALEPVPPAQEPLLRAGFLLVTGLILGLFLGAALFGHKAQVGRMAQRAFAWPTQPRALASGEEATLLPPGHPPVEGFSVPDGDSSGCPYLDSDEGGGAGYEGSGENDEPRPLPRAQPLRGSAQGQVNGPI